MTNEQHKEHYGYHDSEKGDYSMTMDQRSKNRYKEHASHGWVVVPGFSSLQPKKENRKCPCGWFGWVDREDQSNGV